MIISAFFRTLPITFWFSALAVTTPGWSQSFDRGLSAHNRLDDETALRESSESATAGGPQSQFGLGLLHDFGHGVPVDLDIAIYWHEKAARKGDLNARANLHRLTLTGAATQN